MRHLTEAYGVKLGRGKPEKPFDTLQAAIDFINAGMKNMESESYVLYNDGKEMIWLDYYRDRDDHGLGYTVSRHDDKSVVFDEQSGLAINGQKENDEQLRSIVVQEAGRMKYYREAQKFAKLRFVNQTSEPSYIDFDEGCVYYNKQEQLNDAIENLVKQLKAKNESLTELFGFGKKKDPVKRHIVGISIQRANGLFEHHLLSNRLQSALADLGASDIKLYRGKYFQYAASTQFEFVCTAATFEHIKEQVAYEIDMSKVRCRGANPRVRDLENALMWGTLGSVKESLNPDTLAESWYLQEWK